MFKTAKSWSLFLLYHERLQKLLCLRIKMAAHALLKQHAGTLKINVNTEFMVLELLNIDIQINVK